MTSARFFLIGSGFGRFALFTEGGASGLLWVRSVRESAWVEAGSMSLADVEARVAAGDYVEFSPASLLAGVSTPAKSAAARLNGARGGRPRKPVS